MSIKTHLHSHLGNSLENSGDVIEELGERFHQNIKVMEERYQGRWDKRLMADYYWSLKMDMPYQTSFEKMKEKKFLGMNEGKEVLGSNLHLLLNLACLIHYILNGLSNFRRSKTPFFSDRTLFDIHAPFLLKAQIFITRGGGNILEEHIFSMRGREYHLWAGM